MHFEKDILGSRGKEIQTEEKWAFASAEAQEKTWMIIFLTDKYDEMNACDVKSWNSHLLYPLPRQSQEGGAGQLEGFLAPSGKSGINTISLFTKLIF